MWPSVKRAEVSNSLIFFACHHDSNTFPKSNFLFNFWVETDLVFFQKLTVLYCCHIIERMHFISLDAFWNLDKLNEKEEDHFEISCGIFLWKISLKLLKQYMTLQTQMSSTTSFFSTVKNGSSLVALFFTEKSNWNLEELYVPVVPWPFQAPLSLNWKIIFLHLCTFWHFHFLLALLGFI